MWMDFGISSPWTRVPRKDAVARRAKAEHQRLVRQLFVAVERRRTAMIMLHSMARSASVTLVVSSVGELIRGTVCSLV